jgi:hypothetical protein
VKFVVIQGKKLVVRRKKSAVAVIPCAKLRETGADKTHVRIGQFQSDGVIVVGGHRVPVCGEQSLLADKFLQMKILNAAIRPGCRIVLVFELRLVSVINKSAARAERDPIVEIRGRCFQIRRARFCCCLLGCGWQNCYVRFLGCDGRNRRAGFCNCFLRVGGQIPRVCICHCLLRRGGQNTEQESRKSRTAGDCQMPALVAKFEKRFQNFYGLICPN